MASVVDYACHLARGVGSMLSDLQHEAAPDLIGTEELRRRGDAEAQAYIMGRLAEEWPGDAVLSEEAPDTSGRLTASRVWIIDPLDGTREFAEGRADWAVHVALWEEGKLVAGAVALPGLDLVLTSDDEPRSYEPPRALRIAVSRSRPPDLVGYLADSLGAELVPMGSAGYKVAAVVRGEVDAYVHAGGQYEWDSAAPVAVALRAGLHASRTDGTELRYNQPNPFLPDLVVCNPAISGGLLRAIDERNRSNSSRRGSTRD